MDANDKSLLRRLRRCGLVAYPRVAVTISPLRKVMRTLPYSNRSAAAAERAGRMNLPREVFESIGYGRSLRIM